MTSIRSPQQLGETLRVARKQLGLTQPQLALAAGVGVRFIVDLEAGKPTMRLENVLLVTVLRVSLDNCSAVTPHKTLLPLAHACAVVDSLPRSMVNVLPLIAVTSTSSNRLASAF